MEVLFPTAESSSLTLSLPGIMTKIDPETWTYCFLFSLFGSRKGRNPHLVKIFSRNLHKFVSFQDSNLAPFRVTLIFQRLKIDLNVNRTRRGSDFPAKGRAKGSEGIGTSVSSGFLLCYSNP